MRTYIITNPITGHTAQVQAHHPHSAVLAAIHDALPFPARAFNITPGIDTNYVATMVDGTPLALIEEVAR